MGHELQRWTQDLTHKFCLVRPTAVWALLSAPKSQQPGQHAHTAPQCRVKSSMTEANFLRFPCSSCVVACRCYSSSAQHTWQPTAALLGLLLSNRMLLHPATQLPARSLRTWCVHPASHRNLSVGVPLFPAGQHIFHRTNAPRLYLKDSRGLDSACICMHVMIAMSCSACSAS